MEKGKIHRTEAGDLTIVYSAAERGEIKTAFVTGPPKWSYEGLHPHLYVIEFQGRFYGFWNDKDDYSIIGWLMGENEIDESCRLEADSYEALLKAASEKIADQTYYFDGIEIWEKAIMDGRLDPWNVFGD